MADWYAQQHRSIDEGVSSIFHLPTDAPPREIRLLEINTQISEMSPLEAIDFGVDTGSDSSHTLFVLDVTPAQWQAIQKGSLPLPGGWTLDGAREINRRGKS
jgi:hypothetical protein